MIRAALRASWAPLLLAGAWLLATAWARPLAVPDEGRYVGIAWQMLQSGDWLVPRLDGLPFFHKPPLFYWITAAALGVFGPGEMAARVAPLLGGFAGAMAVWVFVRRWRGEAVARWALLALATQPLFFVGAQFANLDMLVAGCITVAVLALAHAALRADEGVRTRGALTLAYVFLALGVLAKGLVGLVLPGLVLLAWLLPRRRWRLLPRLVWIPGVLLFAVLTVPWFAAMQARFPDFAHYFFVVQHFARYATGGFNNPQPPWFFPVVLALLALPWSAWLAGRGARVPGDEPRRALLQLAWTWMAVVVLFFSLPASKLVGYILPAAAPVAWLAAEALHGAGERARALRWWRAASAAAALACVAVVAAGALLAPGSTRELGRALRPLALPGDRLVFLQAYYFDLPFYARWPGSVEVVEAWDDPLLASRDNWRKELADAARFDPDRGRRTLRLPGDLPQAHCGTRPLWVVGRQPLMSQHALLREAQAVAMQRDIVLWRVPPRPLTAPSAAEGPVRAREIRHDRHRQQHHRQRERVWQPREVQQHGVSAFIGEEARERQQQVPRQRMAPGRAPVREGEAPLAQEGHDEREQPAGHVGQQRRDAQSLDEHHHRAEVHGGGDAPDGDEQGDALHRPHCPRLSRGWSRSASASTTTACTPA